MTAPTDRTPCPTCGGQGRWTEPMCCGNAVGGSCCGEAVPMQAQCNDCNGAGWVPLSPPDGRTGAKTTKEDSR